MSYIMYTGEVIEVLGKTQHPQAEALANMLANLTEVAATLLVMHLNIARGDLELELFDGQVAVSFKPAHAGQALPTVLEGYDDHEGWE